MSPAMAADPGWYGGLGIGYSKVKIDDATLTVPGATAFTRSKDESDTGFKFFGGYQFNQNWGLELGYVDLGKFNAQVNVTAPVVGSATANIKASGIFLDLVGTAPLQNNFSVYGKLGAIYAETKTDRTFSGAVVLPAGQVANAKHTETAFKFGLGAQYDFTKTVGLRGEWERYYKLGDSNSTGEGDVDLFSINLVFRF